MRIEKEYVIEELKQRYADSNLMVVTSYHGIKSDAMGELRGKVYDKKATINIVPNRLLKRAMPDSADPAFNELLRGANAVAATAGDIVELSKMLKEFADKNKTFEIRGGLLEMHKFLSQADIISLASLPSKKVLQAQLVCALQGPIRKLAVLFNTMLSNMVRVLDEIAKVKEQESGPAAAPAEAAEEEKAEAAPAEAAEEEKAEAAAAEAAEEEKAEAAPAEAAVEEKAEEADTGEQKQGE